MVNMSFYKEEVSLIISNIIIKMHICIFVILQLFF